MIVFSLSLFLLQLIIVYVILTAFAQLSLQFPGVLSRRSALEAGHVSFPNKPQVLRLSSTTVSPTVQSLKISTVVVPVASVLEKVESEKPLTVTVSTTVPSSHVRREWIPGIFFITFLIFSDC